MPQSQPLPPDPDQGSAEPEDLTAIRKLEHGKALHVYGYQPHDCIQCWPNGTPAPSDAAPAAPTTATTAKATHSAGFESLGSAIARVQAKRALGRGYELPAPDPDPPPACSTCADLGFVRTRESADAMPGEPHFAEVTPCPKCRRPQLLKQSVSEALERARVPEHFRGGSLDNFPVSDASFVSYDEVCAWWEHMRTGQLDRGRSCLLLWGEGTGMGKTSLACSIMAAWAIDQANRYTHRGGPGHLYVPGGGDPTPGSSTPVGSICYDCGLAQDQHPREGHYVQEADLLDELRATYSDGSTTSARQVLDDFGSVPFLIIDDLGTASPTLFVAEKLLQLINRRHDAHLPTILVSNHSLTELEHNYGVLASMRDRASGRNGPVEPAVQRSVLQAAELRGKRLLWRIIEMSTVIEFHGDNLRDPSVRDRLGLSGANGTLPLGFGASPANGIPPRGQLTHPDQEEHRPTF